MNPKKLGLLAVTAAGVVAIAVARSAATSPPAKPATSAPSPARATTGEPMKVTPAHGAVPVAAPNAAPAVPAAPAGPPGKAEIKELVFDAGSVERGADIKHDFSIKNIGDHDLTVDAKPG